IPIAGALLVTTQSIGGRVVAAGALLVSIPAVIMTFSRAGFLTLAATLLLALIWFVKRRAAGVAALVLVVACATMPFLPKGYIDRLVTITDIDADTTGSAQGRWADFAVASRV